MTPATLIHSVTLIDGGAEHPDAWVLWRDGVVEKVGDGTPPPTGAVIDGKDHYLVPGFVDLHSHGAVGVAYDSADAAAIERAVAFHRAHGSTSQMLSLVSAPVATLVQRLGELSDVMTQHPGVLGVHLEGPFLADSHRGAHDPRALTAPTAEAVEALRVAGGDALRMVTIAPELPGALDAIAALAAADIVPAIGHTGADYETALAGFDAGARVLTHAFNGMRGLHHRAPGPVAAAARSGAVLEVIADRVHVHPAMIEALALWAPGRVALVTDAMAATGSDDGTYLLGSLEVEVSAGVARLRDGGSIAGSTLTLDVALRNLAGLDGWDLPQAVAALTSVPAGALGRSDIGSLAPGSAADAVLLDTQLDVVKVWQAGREQTLTL